MWFYPSYDYILPQPSGSTQEVELLPIEILLSASLGRTARTDQNSVYIKEISL